MSTKKLIKPDFLVVPRGIYDNNNLEPHDEKVYAIVYWFQKMKDGICKASNETIAYIINEKNPQPRSVQNSLNRLEQEGVILRVYKDKSKRNRKEIRALVQFENVRNIGRTDISGETASICERNGDDRRERNGDDQKSNTVISNNEDNVYTDHRFAFFWNEYPKKVGKGDAWKSWQRLKISDTMARSIVLSVRQHRKTEQWQREHGRYIPNPSTFLNQRRFDDEPGHVQPPAEGSLQGKYANV